MAKAQSKIFDVFTQADSLISRIYAGSGLGLSICHRLVASMGGNMDFESTEGIGSSFYFELHLTSGKTTAIVDNYEDSTGS